MTSKRIQIGTYLVIGIFLILCFRLWQLQVLEGTKYRKMSEENRLRIVKIPAPRGIIYDRNGTPLVKNVPFYSVSMSPDTSRDIDIDGLSKLLDIKKDDLAEKLNNKNNSQFMPIKLKQGLTFQEIARIEARRSDFPGLFIETDWGREYPFGKVAAHLIGYLGKITSAQMNNPELQHFSSEMLVGQWGVELLYDEQLRGIPGERVIEVDALGRELRMIQEKAYAKGHDLNLSIDISIHKAIENAFGEKAGAFVAIKPDSGEILALESIPSFDPNVFSRGVSSKEWKALMEDPKKPMLNRALQSQYPPGSTFKIITAVAAMEEAAITPETRIYCTGGISYGRWTFGCWRKGGHGYVDFHKGIVESCDVYFYELGKRLGIEKIAKYATALGLGSETGIKLVKERAGLIPSVQWKKEHRGLPWYLGDTFISAIGQGFVTATPIQMALMTATFANGGHVYRPSLVRGDYSPVRTVALKPETIKRVKEGLADVVNAGNGTAQGARSSLALIAGKTGTAQVAAKRKGALSGRFMDHAWFVAFAPVENPEIAVAVFVEHGGGGGAVAAPIAKKGIEAHLRAESQHSSNGSPK